MGKAKVRLKLHQSPAKIEAMMFKALQKRIQQRLSMTWSIKLIDGFTDLFEQEIKSQEFFNSLNASTRGSLKGSLGLVDGQKDMSTIIEFWKEHMAFKVHKGSRTRGSFGGFTMGIIKADYQDVLSHPVASFASEHNFDVDWLQYLLVGGTVFNYRIVWKGGGSLFPDEMFSPPKSRTGLALMLKKITGSWQLPPPYAPSGENNVVIRAFTPAFQSKFEAMARAVIFA